MDYIYHIYANDRSGIYIGQTQQKGYERPLDHFVGVYRAPNENILFSNFLNQHSLDEMQIDIYYGPNYGIEQKELDNFILTWMQDSTKYGYEKRDTYWDTKINNPALKVESIRRNAAEILHTYYYYKTQEYGTVCALSLGGQQSVSFSKEGLVLNRDLSPEAAASLLESSYKSRQNLGELQQTFDKSLQTIAHKTGLYQELFNAWNSSNPQDNIRIVMNNFLTNHLETIIRAMQDKEKGHVFAGYRIKWPKGHMINFQSTKGQQSLNSINDIIVHYFRDHHKSIEKDIEKNPNKMNDIIIAALQQALKSISIASFIEIKTLTDFITESPVTMIKTRDEHHDKNTNSEIISRLKLKSYDYFRRIANDVKQRILGVYNNSKNPFRKKGNLDDDGIIKYGILKLPTFLVETREEYLRQGIKGEFVQNYNKWCDFARGMLTVYTKNNGTIFDDIIETAMIDDIPLGFAGSVEDNNSVIMPAYEFSPITFNYITSHNFDNIESLVFY